LKIQIQKKIKKKGYFFLARSNTVLSAIIAAAGATKATMFAIIGPRKAPTKGNFSRPAEPASNSVTEASKKGIVSLALMFSKPTITPRTTSTTATQPPVIIANPAKIAMAMPARKAYSPIFIFIQAPIKNLFFNF
jgi:hypothetical protein